MLPYLLINLEIQQYYQNRSRFNRVYSRNNILKIGKNATYAINHNVYGDSATLSVFWSFKSDDVTFFDSFGVEYFPKDINKLICYNKFQIKYFYLNFQRNDRTMNSYVLRMYEIK